MISLRVSATKLVNKNEPEEIPKEFPSRLELAMNYTRCCPQYFIPLTIFSELDNLQNTLNSFRDF
jgi:hypothetical protein